MPEKIKIGIIGQGFVGGAVRAYAEKKGVEVFAYDIDPAKSNVSSMEEAIESTDGIVFVCLPTPMKASGECDLSIVWKVVKRIDEICEETENPNIEIILKSTMPPGTTDHWNHLTKLATVRFNPEFLTEANAHNDYANQTKIIIGGEASNASTKLFARMFPNATLYFVPRSEAEMCKYVINTFLAVKVAYANEIYGYCQAVGINYPNMMRLVMSDERVGHTHWSVPGPDGNRGFSGSCFPKDINALIYQMKESHLTPHVLEAAWKRNVEIDRTNHDWEKLLGRAISTPEVSEETEQKLPY